MASDFGPSASEFRDALYEALAGGTTGIRDADPLSVLDRLTAAVSPHAGAAPLAAAAITDLRQVASAPSLEAAIETAAARFDGAHHFRETIYFARCLDREAAVALDLLAGRSYLEDAIVPAAFAELSTDCSAVLDAASFESLWSDPTRAGWMLNTIEIWKREYKRAYLSQHGRYREATASIAEQVDQESTKAAALERLNGLDRLGPPMAVAALSQFRELERLSPCVIDASELAEALAASPRCTACGYDLGQAAPTAEARRVIQAVERGLTSQQSRLARRLVSRIIDRPGLDGDERLDRFVKAVQASDLTSLALVLDDALVDFIRDLLEAPTAEGVLAQLSRSYPEVTAVNLDATVAEFRRLLEGELTLDRAIRLREGRGE